MRRWFSRTGVATILLGLAVAVPCAAWYVTGSSSIEQRARQLEREPFREARREAQQLSQQLAIRLESLRLSESRRPFRDYDPVADELLGDCSYEQRIRSPLASGPTDPLIWSHFQVDQVGQISLPTLDGEGPAADDNARSIQLAIFEELECAGSDRLAQLRHRSKPDEQRLEHDSHGVITVGAFEWHTVTLKAQPALVALRSVSTPEAALTQGFAVLAESLDGLLASSTGAARARPGEPLNEGEARLSLDGEMWVVTLDFSDERALAAAAARELRGRFTWTFFGGSLAALIAGGLLVVLVWQSERTAQQRVQFAASAAHELRTPLAGLQLYGEMLADGSGDSSRRKGYARRIADEAERLGRVVVNVLGFSRLQRGGLSVRPRPGDLAATVRDSVSKLTTDLTVRGARLELSVVGPLEPALFDPDAVHQILQNLVDNAEKYSRSATNRSIEVLLAPGPDGPTLSVVDHGDGIEPSLKRKLFKPFARHPDPEAPAGLGIGLALVQALAREQSASIVYSDVDGGGTCFTVTFKSAGEPVPA